MSPFGEVHHYVAQYGYLAVTVGIMLEDFGLPMPGESLLITGAILASQGTLDIRLLLHSRLGRRGDRRQYRLVHRPLRRSPADGALWQPSRHHPGELEIGERSFQRYGDWVIVFARFIVMLRRLNGIVAGTLEMHWARFLVLNAIGAALWVGFWGTLAHWLGKRIFAMLATMAQSSLWSSHWPLAPSLLP